MIKYRPHRGQLNTAIKEEKTFDTIDEMYDYIVSEWNKLGIRQLFNKDDLVVTEPLGTDDRINWKEFRYVCIKRMRNEIYAEPQCIGMCSFE